MRAADSRLEQVRGEILLQREGAGSAERCFRRAVEIAREQGARLTELESSARLARLLASQGRRDEAFGTLKPVYDWFTEGFDTPLLEDAKALLEELA